MTWECNHGRGKNTFWMALKETTVSWCVYREPCGARDEIGGRQCQDVEVDCRKRSPTNRLMMTWPTMKIFRVIDFSIQILTSDALHVKASIQFVLFFLFILYFFNRHFGWSEREKKRTERQGKERSAASWWIVTVQLFFFFAGLSTGIEMLRPLLAQLTIWTGGLLKKKQCASWNCNSPSFFSCFLFSRHRFASLTSEEESLPTDALLHCLAPLTEFQKMPRCVSNRHGCRKREPKTRKIVIWNECESALLRKWTNCFDARGRNCHFNFPCCFSFACCLASSTPCVSASQNRITELI